MWKVACVVLVAVFAVGEAGMAGGLMDVDFNSDPGAQNALNFSVAEHNRRSNDMFLSQVAEVIRVQKQVVAGMKYVITVRMARTPCRKDHTTEMCAIHQDPELAAPRECTFTVWSQPWLNSIKLSKTTC